MKKCLHLKKTKPHWRRKLPRLLTRQERKARDAATRQMFSRASQFMPHFTTVPPVHNRDLEVEQLAHMFGLR